MIDGGDDRPAGLPTEGIPPTRAPEADAWRDVFAAVLGRDFVPGNVVEILQNGDRVFDALLDAIEGARRTIEFETYLYEDGTVGERFAAALANAVRRGVSVRVLVDGVGAMKGDRSLGAMRDAGVSLRIFRPVGRLRVWRRARLDNRTHRKIMIVDDAVSFLGGVGIADDWKGDAGTEDEWRDTHFAVRGPAATRVFAAFLGHWIECGPVEPDMLGRTPRAAAGDSEVLVLPSVGVDARSAPSLLYHALLQHARERVRITTPYFVPDSSTSAALLACIDRGVRVELLLPGGHTDHRICDIAGQPTQRALHDRGGLIWRYQPTFIHTKCMTVDGLLSVVGSANFNHRSLLKDDEALAIVLDARVAADLDRAFDADVSLSRRTRAEDLSDPGLIRRATEWLARRVRRQL